MRQPEKILFFALIFAKVVHENNCFILTKVLKGNTMKNYWGGEMILSPPNIYIGGAIALLTPQDCPLFDPLPPILLTRHISIREN